MFLEIFRFELKYALKKPSTYVFFSIYFAFYLFLSLAASGVLPLGASDSNTYLNSAVANASLYLAFNQNILALIHNMIIIAIMATAIQRDFEFNSHSLFFTKPITKASYFFGRFLGVLTIALFVFSGQLFGLLLGSVIGSGQPTIGPIHLYNYVQPFLYFVVPNTLLFGTIYFSLTTFLRNTTIAYLFTVIFFLFDLAANSVLSDIDYQNLAAMLDPYGNKALGKVTQYWTPAEQNERLLSLTDYLLYNRLVWLGLGLVIMWFSYVKFNFSQFLNPSKLFSFKKKEESYSPQTPAIQHVSELPKVTISSNGKAFWNQLLFIARFEYKRIIRSYFFIIMLVLGGVLAYITNSFSSLIFGTEVYPVTYNVLAQTGSMFQFMLSILIIFYSGNLVFNEKQFKVDELVGASPVKSSTLVIGKYLGLLGSVALGLLGAIVTGVIIQSLKGYYKFELDQYIESLYGRTFVSLALTAALCFVIQFMVSNKYVGFVIAFIVAFLSRIIFSQLQLTNPLYNFNSSGPMLPYSDMNGFGQTTPIFYLFKLYWLAVIVLLFVISVRFFLRGKEKGLKARFKFSKYDSHKQFRLIAVFAGVVFIGIGGVIYYNIKVANKLLSAKDFEKLQAKFEQTYKHFQKTKQPRVVSSYVEVDLFPNELGAKFKGYYYLKNKHKEAIDTLIINYNNNVDLKSLTLSVPGKEFLNDKDYFVKAYKLASPLQSGDSIRMDYTIDYFQKSWFSNDEKSDVVYNGTFINNSLLPSIGYNEGFELGENEARKKYNLPYKNRMANINDTAAYANTYISKDADWINFECIVSTVSDQIAVAPGYLIKEYTKDNCRYFHYKMDCPILNFYSFLSARYTVKKDKYKNINIEIYYNEGHEYNLDRMINSIKKSLAYYEKSFSPYQHRQVRILEFPRYASFAQSFPNTIPYSESIGFIAHVDEKDPLSIDYPFYVTAHEVAHQWWAHQVIGADVQGSTLMSESMAEYSALMVMEKEYGKEAMHKFLKDALNKYLIGRATEKKKELPIMLAENQQYIHYNKGCLIMYALRDYIGEDSVNAALKRYIKKVGFQSAPYTTAKEFVANMRLSTPDSMQYVIKDLFEDITVYENYVKDLKSAKQADGRYKVTLTVGSVKFKADTLGKSKEVPVNDWMDIGVFTQQEVNGKKVDKELVLKKIRMDKAAKTFEFMVDKEPTSAGLDPYNKLIDRMPENNRCKVGAIPTPPDLSAGSSNVTISL
ncbi:MAG: ABC transporter permease [Bacteroidetes bacterium]|nr:ABC transporter permease [Bacteroidota bacterium]